MIATQERPVHTLYQRVTRLWHDLHQGRSLESEEWARRHFGIVLLLWFHAVGLPAFGLLTTHHVLLGVVGGVILAILAVVATIHRLPRRVRSAITTCGLILSSTFLVHLSGWKGTDFLLHHLRDFAHWWQEMFTGCARCSPI